MISLTKKILSIALAAVLLLGVFPAAAFAAEDNVTLNVYKRIDTLNSDGKYEAGTLVPLDPPTYVTTKDAAMDMNALNTTYAADIGDTSNGSLQGWWLSVDNGKPGEGTVVTQDQDLILWFHADAPAACKHVNTEKRVIKDATYTEAGVMGTFCKDCGAKLKEEPIAKLTRATYTVTVKSGASGVSVPNSTMIVEENGTYKGLVDLSKTGYTFLGYKRLADNTMVSNGDKVLNQNHTLEGQWAQNSYAVRFFDSDGAQIGITETVYHGSKILNVPSYTSAGSKGGKTPKGWSVDTTAPVTRDLDIYPEYANALYTITLKPGYDGGATRYQNVRYGERIGKFFPNGELPKLTRNRYILDGFYLEGTDEKWTAETIYNVEGDVTLVARWVEEARVKVMIYRNGKTSSAYDEIQVPGYKVGDTIYTKDIDIKDYYKNGGKPFKFDGWYDRQGWVYFKAGEFHTPAETVKTVGLDGTTLLFCMITDNSAPSNSNPDRTNPKTGDESMIFATTAVMLVSAGALAIFFMDRKRRNG